MTKSVYAERDTVGTLALKARASGEKAEVGDLSRELMVSFIDDLQKTANSNPFDGKPFYITVHEKKDAQLVNVILRRMVVMDKRPYPETATSVWFVEPKSGTIEFCWHLPHWSQFLNILNNPQNYDKQIIEDIQRYQSEDLKHFGFCKIGDEVTPIPGHKNRPLRRNHGRN